MGLFDRLRRAFSGEPEKDKEKEEQLQTSEENQTSEVATATSESDASVETSQTASSESQSETVEQTSETMIEPESEMTQTEESSSTKEVVTASMTIESSEVTTEEVVEEITEEVIEPATTEPKQAEVEVKEEVSETTRYDKGLAKSRKGFGAKINALLANFRRVDEDFFEELEETLIEADVGFETAMKISDELQDEVKLRNAKSKSDVSDAIIERLVDIYENEGQDEDNTLHFASEGPTVFLFVGVNGVGKTTTIGKLAHRYQQEGKKVLLAAGDTFRAGAIEQLAEWGKRVGVDVVTKPEKSDPAAVVYDAVIKAKKEDYDILLVDTAGRLQNKVNLMKELDKIKRVITRELPDAPQEVLLALDATTGQNALTQAKQFKEVTDVTGIVLTKLDGTARGGIVLAIRNELHLPVKLVGLGEKMDDLRDFSPEEFVYGLFKGLVTPKKD
ncbi:signal recognition particle-docking protein FtsY [Ligilactobacillus apodemi]|uniref:Signal recognition particle receptor FtsY n=1 Tax=Ligilactobacillus apodemi DSM 16634 = JCM 16172 TaxID=1423724 RepID=A0A0R1TQK0_9LACO|nr:signal recognition particle-docking protein FtsY [Ligilactobacillus apodemi]KRL83729.1 cell division protein FtsY [Ligilactobacillus apodemi DSM 16634 = JCM 16172]